MARTVRHGFSRLSVIVALLGVVILFTIALPLANRYRRDRLSMRDSAQLKDIHQAWITFAREFSSIPGQPGLGLDDRSLSPTANRFPP